MIRDLILPPRRSTGAGSFCNVDDLIAYKTRLLAPFNALAVDIDACTRLSDDQKLAFSWDLAAFKLWIKRDVPVCFADAEIREGNDFETKMNVWRGVLQTAQCVPSAPVLTPLPDTDPRSPNYVEPESFVDKLLTLSKVGAVIGGIGLAAYGAYLVTPMLLEWRATKGKRKS